MKFWIRFGSINGMADWEEIEAGDLKEAEEIACQQACEDNETYEDLHGCRSVTTIMEEDDLDEDEADRVYEEERDSWIDYEASTTKPKDFDE